MDYTPHTDSDVRAMLARIGVERISDLFRQIPEDLRRRGGLRIAPGLSEVDLRAHIGALASRNRHETVSFVGAGAYPHFVPSAVDALASRSEFATAYTPYQAEASQGTLQAIFEFQTMSAILLGVEVANASMYDGASAAAEAALMALRIRSGRDGLRGRVIVARSLHPSVRDTIRTYAGGLEGVALSEAPFDESGRIDLAAPTKALGSATGGRENGNAEELPVACVVVGYPNFFGIVEDLPRIVRWARERNALVVTVTLEAVALGLLAAPGSLGADIAVAEGQSLGLSVAFGGPGVGMLGTRERYLRSMPGRLVGETVDADGRRGFVLTLSTREQHIRRERATSNICTNHSLCALAVAVHLSLLGRAGLAEIARLNARKARYAAAMLARVGLSPRFSAPYFNEVALRGADIEARFERVLKRGTVVGLPLARHYPELADCVLVCATEVHRRTEIERMALEWGAAAGKS